MSIRKPGRVYQTISPVSILIQRYKKETPIHIVFYGESASSSTFQIGSGMGIEKSEIQIRTHPQEQKRYLLAAGITNQLRETTRLQSLVGLYCCQGLCPSTCQVSLLLLLKLFVILQKHLGKDSVRIHSIEGIVQRQPKRGLRQIIQGQRISSVVYFLIKIQVRLGLMVHRIVKEHIGIVPLLVKRRIASIVTAKSKPVLA